MPRPVRKKYFHLLFDAVVSPSPNSSHILTCKKINNQVNKNKIDLFVNRNGLIIIPSLLFAESKL